MQNDIIFVDYEPAENCRNVYSFGMICVKCGKCGRRFENGILQEEGIDNAE